MLRRSRIETKINHERWLVSYADFITLLFAFFVVMYSVSQVNENKYRTLSETLETAFSGGNVESADGQTESETRREESSSVAKLGDIAGELDTVLSDVLGHEDIKISGNEQWLEIELDANLLFSSGSDVLADQAQTLLSSVADVLSPYDNAIAIEGHTDDLPISNQKHSNNWELSSSRAVAVVSLLSYQGIAPERLSAVGYGEYRPIVANDSDEGRSRNRRVVLKVAHNAVPAQKTPIEKYSDEDRVEAGGQTNSIEAGSPITIPILDDITPVRLRGGGLLFSSDPNLPRTNPPIETKSQDTPETQNE